MTFLPTYMSVLAPPRGATPQAWTLERSSVGYAASEGRAHEAQLPNKRLKLAGGDRFKGTGVLCPWQGTDFVPHPCAGKRVARSLSAIR